MRQAETRCSCGTTPRGNQSQAQTAAEGGAGRRSAKNAARPLNQSREAHLAAWPLHSPEGGQSAAVFAADWPHEGDWPAPMRASGDGWGTPLARVGISVGVRVGISVGISVGGRRPDEGRVSWARRWAGQGCGACQRSSTRRRRVPPLTTTSGRPAWVPARLSSTNGCTASTYAVAGSRTFALDSRASCPSRTTRPRAIRRQPSRGEEGSSPRTPLLDTSGTSRGDERSGRTPSRWVRVTIRWAHERRARVGWFVTR
jgi:hypothetical protein